MRSHGEGSIRKRRNGTWEARVSIDGRQVSFYAPSKTAAMAKARQARANAERGSGLVLPTVTVATYLAVWLDLAVRPRTKPATHATYANVCRRHISPAIGHIRLARLTPTHVEAMMAGILDAGLSETTARHARDVLANALTAAERDHGLLRNVARLARPPRSSPFVPERLTIADVRAVLAAVHGDRIEPAVRFSVATGVRHGEMRALHRDDIDGRTMTVRHSIERRSGRAVRPKNGRVRVMALSDIAVAALDREAALRAADRAAAGAAWRDTGVVFAGPLGGVQSQVWAGRRLRRCVTDAGLPQVRWHALRRMFAAVLLDQGVPLHRIRDLLGHAHVAVTEHYAYVMEDALVADVKAIDRALD